MADRPEKLNDRYTLIKKIASGGMAEVYLAQERGAQNSEKFIAIKKILSNYSTNPDYKKMFIDEGIVGCQLIHPNICQVSPLIEIEPHLYIPMEFIAGKNLLQITKRHRQLKGNTPFQIPLALFIINEVLKGLDYAHNKIDDRNGNHLNIIHRDMSPSNIMVSYQGSIKVIDFGVVKSKIRDEETQTGIIKGKFTYMSPEQALAEPLGPESDLFSVGIILWEMLTGKSLFRKDSDIATLTAIQKCDLSDQDAIRHNPEIMPLLNDIVMKALAKNRSKRYQTAEQMQQDIQQYIYEKYSSVSSKMVSKFLEEYFSFEILSERTQVKELSNILSVISAGEGLSKVSVVQPFDEEVSSPGGTVVSKADNPENSAARKLLYSSLAEKPKPKSNAKELGGAFFIVAVVLPLGFFLVTKGMSKLSVYLAVERPVTINRHDRDLSSPSENKNLCEIIMETEPPGAQLIGENFEGSSTNGSILAPCDKNVIVRVEKENFKTVKVPVWVIKKQLVVPVVKLQSNE